jgi:hypothetical protein
MPSPDPASPSSAAAWLRKLVLQTLFRASDQEPLLFLDASVKPIDPALAAIRTGLRDGVRQFYASQRLDVSERQAEEMLGIR